MARRLALSTLAALALPARVAAAGRALPSATVASVFARIETFQKQEFNKNAYEIRQLDKSCEALAPEVIALGAGAAQPLLDIARDPKKADKERLFAASFLGLLDDPAAFLPLRAIALSPGPDALRSTALSSLENTGVDAPALRRAACLALSQEDLPPLTLASALTAAARTGCDDPRLLHGWAERFGQRPDGASARLAGLAHATLARSYPLEAARLLWRLFRFYPPASAQRLSVLSALWDGRESQKQLGGEASRAAQEALRSEGRSPANAVAALKLAAFLDDGAAARPIAGLLGNADPEVAVSAAEALARIGASREKAALDKMLASALSDKRFVPGGKRSVRWDLVDRLKKAARNLDPQAPSPY